MTCLQKTVFALRFRSWFLATVGAGLVLCTSAFAQPPEFAQAPEPVERISRLHALEIPVVVDGVSDFVELDSVRMAVLHPRVRSGEPTRYALELALENRTSYEDLELRIGYTVEDGDGWAHGGGSFGVFPDGRSEDNRFLFESDLFGLEPESIGLVTMTVEPASATVRPRSAGGLVGVAQQSEAGACISFCDRRFTRAEAICTAGISEYHCSCTENGANTSCTFKCVPRPN